MTDKKDDAIDNDAGMDDYAPPNDEDDGNNDVIVLDDDDDDDGEEEEDEDDSDAGVPVAQVVVGDNNNTNDAAATAAPATPSLNAALSTLAAAAAASSPSPSSVPLAGFADAVVVATTRATPVAAAAAATPPTTKSKLFNWMTSTPLFGSKPIPTTTTTTATTANATTLQVTFAEDSKKGGGVELFHNDDNDDDNTKSEEEGGKKDDHVAEADEVDESNQGGGALAVTPAAEAVLNAIPMDTSITTTAITLMDEEDEEKEDADIEEIMREMRHENNDVDKEEEKEEVQVVGTDNETRKEGGNNTTSDAEEIAARNASDILNRDALYSTYESNYAALQSERDALRRHLSAAQAEADKRSKEMESLRLEYNDMKVNVRQGEEKIVHIQMQLSSEQAQRIELQRTLERCDEKADRADREADSLRAEISRLTQANQELNAHLSSMSVQHSVSASEAIPLRLQAKRLEQELHAVTMHSNYLEGELSNKNEMLAESERNHAKEVRVVRGELDRVRLSLERRDAELVSMRMSNERTANEIDRLRKQFHDKELEYTSQYELLEQDLNKERELVMLKDQRASLAEDRYEALQREVTSLTEMARKASDEATTREENIRQQYTEKMEEALHRVREEERRKVEELEERVRHAEEAKLKMEEQILKSGGTPRRRSSSRRMIAGGGTGGGGEATGMDDSSNGNSLLLLDDGEGPLGLTDLYTRLAETEDDLRAERQANQKLKIIIDRIHRDVAAKTPIFHQRQLELEGALEELEVTRERLEYARREYLDIRADNQDLELQNRQLERECAEWKKENVDLATQVQSLLQRRAAQAGDFISFDSIVTLQKQNQQLVREHASMSTKITELEEKIKNDPDVIELNSLRSEVGSLREERETQAKLVAGIVHQRDLYRALVAKNDAPLLLSQEGSTSDQLALIDARAEQLPLIEARNRDLADEVAKWKAEASSSKHEREALEGRLARLTAHADELTTSNERLRGDLTTAKATAARLEIDVSHYQGQVERLEMSLGMTKSENESESRRRTDLEEILGKTESHLETVRSELAKKEQLYQQATSKIRLLEVQLESSTSNEKRIESEASSLRSEIARQETLLSSVQRIEASLSAKSEAALEKLQDELLHLKELKSDDDAKHSATNQKLEGKIADLELIVKDLTSQKEAAVVDATKAKLEVSKLKLKVQELTLNLKTSEKELMTAKIKLGDVTIDTSAEEAAEAKIAALSTELESVKSELELAQKRVSDYQAIAKSSEEQLTELTAASTKYKEETALTLEKLRKSEQSQRESVVELTNDLMSHRSEKEKAINELNATIDSLTSQLVGSKTDAAKAIARMESLIAEAKRYQLDAKNANINYERELALHAEARTELRDTRSALESEQHLRENVESQLASSLADFEAEKVTWESAKMKLEESVQEAKSRLEIMRSQNNILHDQMASLSETVKKFQSDKASRLIGDESQGTGETTGAAGPVGEKQLSDLRELLKFKQAECTMLEADLASAKRASERERTTAEVAKRSLEEARAELKVLQKGNVIDDAGGAPESEIVNLRAQLKSADDQLVLIRESNTMLREESQKMAKKLSDVTSEFVSYKSTTASQVERMKNMEIVRSSLEAEKESFSQEVEAWKKRVHSLVSRFNQIDPEEHAQALASVEKLKSEYAALKSQAEASATKAEGLIASLNKEVASQKASIGAFKAALEKTKKEKEELSKAANSNMLAMKKMADAQAASKKTEADLTAAKAEVTALNARVMSLKKILSTMQTNLQATKASEIKARASEESLQKEITSLKEQLVTSNSSEAASITAIQSAAGEKTQGGAGIGDALTVASEPTDVEKANEMQQDDSTTTQDLALTENRLSAKTIVQPTPTAETVETSPESNQNVVVTTTAADVDQKKGRKRKANAPKKNATLESDVEIVDAPPLKKAATQAIAAKEANASGVETEPINESAVLPTQTKIVQKKMGAKAVALSPATMEVITEEQSAKAVESTKLPLSKKFTKKLVATKKDSPSTPLTESSTKRTVPTANNLASTAESKKEEEMRMKLELMKKKKATALARKLEAEKQLSAKKLKTETNVAQKGPVAPAAGNPIDSKTDEPAGEKSTADQKSPLTPVLENAEVNAMKVASTEDTTPKPLMFGSSSTVTTLPIPNTTTMQSEPDCPKPSSFGASTVSTFGGPIFPLGGAAPTNNAFGSGATSTFAFGEAATKKEPEESDVEEIPKPGGGSEAFLNLTPPGRSGGMQGKFVFGKTANITLAVPSGTSMTAAQTLASFGKTGLANPFGGAFGGAQSSFGTSPFGGGIATLPLAAASTEEQEQPKPLDAPEEEEEEEEEEEGEVLDDAGAKSAEASPDVAADEA